MLRTLSSPQLSELEAFWIAEGGWGEYKQDYRFGQLCSMHANINRDKKRKQEPYKADDFVMRPKFSQEDEEQDQEQKVRAQLDAMAGGEGKKKRRKKKA